MDFGVRRGLPSGIASGRSRLTRNLVAHHRHTGMTKADIVQAVYARLGGFSKKESADLVDLVFETMKETLGRGEKIKISGFGNFVLRDKRQRQGRNPQTGDPITITERRVLSFKASQLLKLALNDERDGKSLDTKATSNGSSG
jgi:integration host factor subunit alpha